MDKLIDFLHNRCISVTTYREALRMWNQMREEERIKFLESDPSKHMRSKGDVDGN